MVISRCQGMLAEIFHFEEFWISEKRGGESGEGGVFGRFGSFHGIIIG